MVKQHAVAIGSNTANETAWHQHHNHQYHQQQHEVYHLLIQRQDCCHITAAVAVVRGAPNSNQIVVRKHVFVPKW